MRPRISDALISGERSPILTRIEQEDRDDKIIDVAIETGALVILIGAVLMLLTMF